MRHMPPAVYELGLSAKRALWPVLNEASRNATYNVCCAHLYDRDGCDRVHWHTDTKPSTREQWPGMMYVEPGRP